MPNTLLKSSILTGIT